MITKQVELVALTIAEDLSLGALFDACRLSEGKNVRIVGGQMARLLTEAFPTPNSYPRGTVDADAALDSELAATGEMHDIFVAAGYEASAGNSYQKTGKSIDLLVGSLDGRFSSQILGQRSFDASPGISSALNTEPLVIELNATFLNGEQKQFKVRVPRVETALTLKALVYNKRMLNRDLLDVQNLLWIAKHYTAEEIGGWELNTPLRGARGDAQRALHALAEAITSKQVQERSKIRPLELKQLIQNLIAKP